ncbi:MAG: CBS domain-containing protein [Actinobacteria bacterium]|nr:MAG: CBS domain-containing protein [Actinomycetota bacterium]
MATKIREIMSRDVKTVTPETGVKDAARIMVENDIGALPVVNQAGQLVGLVTESDLILQDVKVRFPSYLQLLDGFIYLGSLSRFENTLRRAVAARVADVMSTDVLTIKGDAGVEDAATMMVERDISRLPVVNDEGAIEGIVTKHDIVRAISRT